MTTTTLSKIEEVLQTKLAGESGDNVYVNETDAMPYHPQAVTFFCEDPNCNFDGYTKKPLFETNMLLGETDDDKKYRIERKDGVLIYTRYDVSSGNGCYYATGQAIECEPGSDAEGIFLAQCMGDMMEAASEPLVSLMQKAREANLKPSYGVETKLRQDIFGA